MVALTGLAHELGYDVTVEQVGTRLPRPAAGGEIGRVFVAEDSAGRLLGWIQVQPRSILVDSRTVERPTTDAAAFYEACGFTREKTQNVFLKEIGSR